MSKLGRDLASILDGFELRASSDFLKRDLELVCAKCGEHLCDAEHGDTLAVLVCMALEHEHKT